MSYRAETKQLIFSLLHESSPDHENVVRLVQLTRAIAKSYLKNYYSSFLRLCAQYGMTEDDLSEDSILQIFARNKQGEFYILKNFTESLDSEFKETSEDEVFTAYQAFVQTVAIRQLIKTYSDVDSTGAKIYRNIRDSIRKLDEISVTRDFRGLVIIPSNHSLEEHLPALPFKELEQQFIKKVIKPYTTPDLLLTLMSLVQKQNSFRNSIQLFQVVKLFKRHYSHITNNDIETNKKIDLTTLSSFDHSIILITVL